MKFLTESPESRVMEPHVATGWTDPFSYMFCRPISLIQTAIFMVGTETLAGARHAKGTSKGTGNRKESGRILMGSLEWLS